MTTGASTALRRTMRRPPEGAHSPGRLSLWHNGQAIQHMQRSPQHTSSSCDTHNDVQNDVNCGGPRGRLDESSTRPVL